MPMSPLAAPRRAPHPRRRRVTRSAAACLALLVLGCLPPTPPAPSALPAASTASACFPVEGLAPADRRVAEHLLLRLGDGEALYTLAGGIKPLSSDVADLQLRVAPTADSVSLAQLDQLRRVTAALHCGEIGAFVQLFAAPQRRADSTLVRSSAVVLYHRRSLRALVERQAPFFAALGVTPAADPRDLVEAVEHAERAPRWRGYGYLFGYPDDAVDFFVRAGIEGDRTGQLVPRDFRRIETVRKFPETRDGPAVLSAFVYAVPKGAPEGDGDRRLRTAAAPAYARYVRERARFVAADSTGAVALWRAWLAPRVP